MVFQFTTLGVAPLGVVDLIRSIRFRSDWILAAVRLRLSPPISLEVWKVYISGCAFILLVFNLFHGCQFAALGAQIAALRGEIATRRFHVRWFKRLLTLPNIPILGSQIGDFEIRLVALVSIAAVIVELGGSFRVGLFTGAARKLLSIPTRVTIALAVPGLLVGLRGYLIYIS